MIVRPATPADVPAIHALLKAFGAHGGNPDWVRVSPDQLHAIFFGPTAWCAAHVAERGGGVAGQKFVAKNSAAPTAGGGGIERRNRVAKPFQRRSSAIFSAERAMV